jgi:SNF2 family DNA or RNA helicase
MNRDTFPHGRPLQDLLRPEQHAELLAWPFFDHQRDHVAAQLHDPQSRLLAGDPGVGKTLALIALAWAMTKALANAGTWRPIIYAMPANLIAQVRREFQRFAPDLRITLLRTGKDAIPTTGDFDVLLTSYTLPVTSRRIAETIAAIGSAALMLLDESHQLRNVQAKRTRFWIGQASRAGLATLSSGTPTVNSGEDLYTTFRVLGLLASPGIGVATDSAGILRDATFNEWCRHFVIYKLMSIGGRQFSKAAGTKHTDVLNATLAPRMTRWRAAELLSLPPVIFGTHLLEIPDVLDTLQSGEIAPSPAMLRLRELLAQQRSGETISDVVMEAALAAVSQLNLATYRRAIGAAKAPGVAEFVITRLDAGGAPTLVFGHHREVLQRISDDLAAAAIDHGLLYGDTPQSRRDTLIQQFQSGASEVLVLQIDVAGLGFNLQQAGFICFAELPWTAAAFQQAVARAHRAGQHQHVHVVTVTVPDSLDEIMARIIARKAAEARAVLDQPRQHEESAA